MTDTSNDEIKNIFWECYNVFWKKWRLSEFVRQAPEWDEIVEDAKSIMRKYNHAPIAVHLMQDLLDVLEIRMMNAEKKRGEEISGDVPIV